MTEKQTRQLLEAIPDGRPSIRYEVETPFGLVQTHDERDDVWLCCGVKRWTQNSELANAVKERCKR
jgi:hypothetical protein